MNIVVIGGGLAGVNAVQELRDQGYDGDVTLAAAESHLPYERPPLSKGLLLGKADLESVFVHDASWYTEHGVDLRSGAPVTDLDLGGRRVTLADDLVPYDKLLLATGARPRRLPLLESSALDVLYLRTVDDALALRSRLSGHVLIVGAGWIGLEVAAAARLAGATVTVVESAELPLLGVLGPEVAPVFADLHRDHGVDLRLRTSIETLIGSEVVLSDGYRLKPDLVVVGIGAVPNTELAVKAGLATDDGVLVDAGLRSSNPDIYAAGDVAYHDHPQLGWVRVEHWDNAIKQGRHAAAAMLGSVAPYNRQPYFFTDQYDLGMEYVGHASGHEEVVIRGCPEERVLTAIWIRNETVVAGMHINDWDAIEPLRQIVGQPADANVRDPSIELAGVVASR